MCNHEWMAFGTDQNGDYRICSKCNKKVYIVTNSDRIRAMSDEALAEWLCQSLDCDFCKAYLQNMSIYSCCENQAKGIFDWLQKPAKENT